MLQIRLDGLRSAGEADPLGRATIGYQQGMSEQQAWDAGRGVWKMNADRVLEHEEAQIIDPGGVVRAVARITGISKHGDRRAIEGQLLSGDGRVGRQTTTPHPSRNPVHYIG
ncbi:hypothetical protein [Nocardia altamirensis]|uniref:hypothetical protein n=1 Tax=Nocardia altamirensis TaxID=472158 RepID=UPI000A007A24|nr:hypothetical protein [Nocardia altamirensis]